MALALSTSYELSSSQFRLIARKMDELAGIHLGEGKEGLVKSRLSKRIRRLGLGSFQEYLDLVGRTDPPGRLELLEMVDALTTNKTSFFRESRHFDYLVGALARRAGSSAGRLRIWSAGCSTGEEPYSLAMALSEAGLGDDDVRILATDISRAVLGRARSATYPLSALDDVPVEMRRRYFQEVDGAARVRPELRRLVQFARLNLMAEWPMRGPFDAIFCRNVMIYFEKATQERLVARFRELLPDGGLLFVGHSESLTGLNHGMHYIQPAVYAR